jgi:mannosyltransferase
MLYRINSSSGIQKFLPGGYLSKAVIAASLAGLFFFYLAVAGLPKNAVLTEDELWGATLANLSFFKSIVFVLRFDIHPPLYYMQLNLWALAGRGDLWLQMNSLAWLLGTAAIVWHLARRHGNSLAAAIAAAFVLTSPSLVHYAFEVRMYTFLGFLTVLDLLFSETLFETFATAGMPTRRQWLAVFLAHLAICYSYATGSFIVAAHFCYGLLSGLRLQLPRRFYWRWFGLHVAVGALSLPVAVNSMIREVGHASVPDARAVVSTVAELFAGFHVEQLEPLTFLAFAIPGLMLAGFLLVRPNPRHLLIAYLVFPLTLVFVASHILRPVWLTRSFLFAMPVAGIALGRCFADGPSWLTRTWIGKTGKLVAAAACIVLVCLQMVIGYESALAPKEPDYSILAKVIRTRAHAGDCVIALSHYDVFWGTVRYLAGPDWKDGLQIQAPPDKRWAVIMRSLPPNAASFLGLTPRSDRFDVDGIHIVSGYPSDASGTCNAIFAAGRAADFLETPEEIADGPLLATSGRIIIRGPVNGASVRR